MQDSGGGGGMAVPEFSGGSAWIARPPAPTASAASSPSPACRLHERTGQRSELNDL